jgi:hypothetical protein
MGWTTGVWFPVGEEFLLHYCVQTGSGVHSASYSKGSEEFFPQRWSGWGVKLTTLVHLEPRLRMCGAILVYYGDQLITDVSMAWRLISHWHNFTFTKVLNSSGSRTRRFTTANTKAYHWTWSWASSIHSLSSQCLQKILLNVIFPFILTGLFATGFLTKILCTFIGA